MPQLPTEILLQIFELFMPHPEDLHEDLGSYNEAHLLRTSLCRLSHGWKHVIENTPPFWTTIFLKDSTHDDTSRIQLWLQRSGVLPLDISIETDYAHMVIHPVSPLLGPEVSRIRTLLVDAADFMIGTTEISIISSLLRGGGTVSMPKLTTCSVKGPFHLLVEEEMLDAPALEFLTVEDAYCLDSIHKLTPRTYECLRTAVIRSYDHRLSGKDLAWFYHCPNMEHLTWNGVDVSDTLVQDNMGWLDRPKLASLKSFEILDWDCINFKFEMKLLAWVDMPALSHFHYAYMRSPLDDILSISVGNFRSIATTVQHMHLFSAPLVEPWFKDDMVVYSRLHSLRLEKCDIGDGFFRHLLRCNQTQRTAFPALKEVKLEFCTMTSSKILEKLLHEIANMDGLAHPPLTIALLDPSFHFDAEFDKEQARNDTKTIYGAICLEVLHSYGIDI